MEFQVDFLFLLRHLCWMRPNFIQIKTVLNSFIFALVISNFATNSDAKTEVQTKKPNIILILADDLGYGDLSCYGATKIQTPRIDALAKDGIRFTQAYAPSSVCSPSRYAIQTGRYDWRTAEHTNVIPEHAPLHIEPGRLTIASMLRKSGYSTAYVGKWHLGIGMNQETDWNAPLKPGPLEVGYDSFFGLPANHENFPEIYIRNHEVLNRIPGQSVGVIVNENISKTKGVQPIRDNEACGPELARHAAELINQANPEKPFFLFYSPIEPHNPITPHPDFKNTSQCGAYGDFVQQLDANVGILVDTLKKKNLLDNTLIIFTSDNGGLVADKNGKLPQSEALKAGHAINGDLRGRKHYIYEGGIRVPFIAHWPKHIAPTSENHSPISLVDMIATIGDVVDYKFQQRELIEDSFSVLPAILNKRETESLRPPVISVSAIGVFMVRDGKWKMIEKRKRFPAMFQKNTQHLEWWGYQNERQLYDLNLDPAESKNLAEQEPEIYSRLGEIIDSSRRDGSSKGVNWPQTN